MSKTVYNLAAAAAFLTSGAVVSASMGSWALGGYLMALFSGAMLALVTVCHRCSYYGHRCALGAGKLVPLVRGRGRSDEFGQTRTQFLVVVLLAAVPAVALVGAGHLLLAGEWLRPSLFLVSALALFWPHPRWMCRYCVQRERGCPVGSLLVRPTRFE
ncbi:hypothetical protein ACFL5O_04740 [Myxococcota bacterium]